MTAAVARGYAPYATSLVGDTLLEQIVDHADMAEPGSLAVFDLDGTLFDTRHRQVRILREIASLKGWWDLYDVRPEHFVGRDLGDALRRAGLTELRVQQLLPEVTDFWQRTFLDYVQYDHAMPGAAALVRACAMADLEVVYFTARTRSLRTHTEENLLRFGFPPGAILDKPNADLPDLRFKEWVVPELGNIGIPAIYLDNEPVTVNMFRRTWPRAMVVFVETDHAPTVEAPHPSIPWLRSYLRS